MKLQKDPECLSEYQKSPESTSAVRTLVQVEVAEMYRQEAQVEARPLQKVTNLNFNVTKPHSEFWFLLLISDFSFKGERR